MRSKFVIKTDKKAIGANGVIIPPIKIEAEVEYDLAEVAGMYELYKKIIKELPELKSELEKMFGGFGAGSQE